MLIYIKATTKRKGESMMGQVITHIAFCYLCVDLSFCLTLVSWRHLGKDKKRSNGETKWQDFPSSCSIIIFP